MLLLNIQGLSKSKVFEVEQLIKQDTLLCLTETQQKFDQTMFNQHFDRYMNMRTQTDKKGGGLMILHRDGNNFQLNKMETKHKDLLILSGNIKHQKITIMLVYLSVIKNELEKIHNRHLLDEAKRVLNRCNEEEIVFILGDFNGHLGFIGQQTVNYNGQIVLDFVTEQNLIILNDTPKCSGTYTWSRNSQKSSIDFVLTNNRAYNMCTTMNIDEKQDIFDLSDHNIIEVKIDMQSPHTNYERGTWEEREYFRTDEESMAAYIAQLENNLKTNKYPTITKFNDMVYNAAQKTLKATYRKRTAIQEEFTQEAPWVTTEIRNEIKIRKTLNRGKRTYKDEEDRILKTNLYTNQKQKVQILIKEEMQKYEVKLTESIRQDKSRGKKIWENINKLRGKPNKLDATPTLYNEDGTILTADETSESIEEYWTTIYKKHRNDIGVVWNRETKKMYAETIERELQKNITTHNNATFPSHLREHFDGDIQIGNTIMPMRNPQISREELTSQMKNI